MELWPPDIANQYSFSPLRFIVQICFQIYDKKVNNMFTLNIRGKLWFINHPIVMGIINATPVSFYRGDMLYGTEGMIRIAEQMIAEGASIIDVGGQSTRSGSKRISAKEETDRVIPLLTELNKRFPDTVVSIDTYQSEVAKAAADAGAGIINDISAGIMDPKMLTTAAKLKLPYIAMHMKGTPENMQEHTQYNNLITEIFDHLKQRIFRCTEAGITDIIIDPGFGFAKTVSQNFTLLKSLMDFKWLGKPILAGLSRKTAIYKTLNTTPDEALNGTTALNMIALQQGASILRVHDVKPAMEAIKLQLALSEA